MNPVEIKIVYAFALAFIAVGAYGIGICIGLLKKRG